MKLKVTYTSLGKLELKIMEMIWKLESATVRDILNSIKTKKKPAYTTIMTVMSRLHKKGILKRKFKNNAFIYIPVQDKLNFFASASKKIIYNLIDEFGEDVAVAQFIDIIQNGNIKMSR